MRPAVQTSQPTSLAASRPTRSRWWSVRTMRQRRPTSCRCACANVNRRDLDPMRSRAAVRGRVDRSRERARQVRVFLAMRSELPAPSLGSMTRPDSERFESICRPSQSDQDFCSGGWMGRWRSGLIGVWLIAIVPGVSLAQVGAGAVSVVVADQAGAVARRNGDGGRRRHQRCPDDSERCRRRRHLSGARAWSLSGARRTDRFRPLTREGIGSPPVRPSGSTSSSRSARDRSGDGDRRRAAAAQRDLGPRPGHRQPQGRRAAAERPQLHHPGGPGARRGAAARVAAAAHQRRPAADQRVSVRRHLGAAAGARAGGVLPEHRRDPGVQDREQQPAGRVRALQRRRRQPDDEGGQQRAARHRLRVLPPRSAERAQFLRLDRPRSSRRSAATSSAASSAARSGGTGRSSSSTIRGSGRRSAAR